MNYEANYSKKDAFELYDYYLAVKAHFTRPGYDFFKYNGKTNASVDSFDRRNDRFSFYKLTRYSYAHDVILANILHNPKVWSRQLLEDDSLKRGREHSKRMQSMTYVFKTELGKLDDDFNSNFVVKGGDHPKILRMYHSGEISIETLIILNDITHCFAYWDKNVDDPVIWPDLNRLCERYKPFLQYDKRKMRKVVADMFFTE